MFNCCYSINSPPPPPSDKIIMDWYLGSNMDDFVVPNDQEVSDRLPSPESWVNWGLSEPENFTFPNKWFVTDSNSTHQKLNFNGGIQSNEVEIECCSCDKDQSSSTIGGGSSESSLHLTAPSIYQLDGFGGFEHADDLFLSPFTDDFPATENFRESFCFDPELQNDMVHGGSTSMDMTFDDESISMNAHSMGSSKYLKIHAFSPSPNQEKTRVSAPQFSPCGFEQKDCPSVKAPPGKVAFSLENNSTNEQVDEETSLEEYVLQELEMVMAQMNDKTRLCFRDALYRLAKNSKQNGVTQKQNRDIPTLTDQEHKLRHEEKRTTELETNTIDRAIANLMFNMMDINVNDFPVAAAVSINFNNESSNADSPNQQQMCSSPQYQGFFE